MNDGPLQLPMLLPLAAPLLLALLRTGLVLTFSALALSAFLRVFRVASPTVRRITYAAVLAQGWLFLQGPLTVPMPKVLEAMNTKTSADTVATPAPANVTAENAENPIVTDQSLEQLRSRAGGLRPWGPRTNAAPPDVRGDQPGGSWYRNEWDSSTSAHAGCHWTSASSVESRQLWAASALPFDDPSRPGLSSESQKNVDDPRWHKASQTLATRRIEDTAGLPPLRAGADGRLTIKRQSTGEPKLSPDSYERKVLLLLSIAG
jgi:hypothetical protein